MDRGRTRREESCEEQHNQWHWKTVVCCGASAVLFIWAARYYLNSCAKRVDAGRMALNSGAPTGLLAAPPAVGTSPFPDALWKTYPSMVMQRQESQTATLPTAFVQGFFSSSAMWMCGCAMWLCNMCNVVCIVNVKCGYALDVKYGFANVCIVDKSGIHVDA